MSDADDIVAGQLWLYGSRLDTQREVLQVELVTAVDDEEIEYHTIKLTMFGQRGCCRITKASFLAMLNGGRYVLIGDAP